jgi:hypothetical protein
MPSPRLGSLVAAHGTAAIQEKISRAAERPGRGRRCQKHRIKNSDREVLRPLRVQTGGRSTGCCAVRARRGRGQVGRGDEAVKERLGPLATTAIISCQADDGVLFLIANSDDYDYTTASPKDVTK